MDNFCQGPLIRQNGNNKSIKVMISGLILVLLSKEVQSIKLYHKQSLQKAAEPDDKDVFAYSALLATG